MTSTYDAPCAQVTNALPKAEAMSIDQFRSYVDRSYVAAAAAPPGGGGTGSSSELQKLIEQYSVRKD